MAFVGDGLDRFARDNPDGTALSCGAVRITWSELLFSVDAVAQRLSRLTQPGGRVVLNLQDPASLVRGFFACARAGRVAVVTDPGWPAATTGDVLAAITPDLVVDDTAYAELEAITGSIDAGQSGPQDPPVYSDLFYAGFTSGSSGTPKGYVRSHGSWLESFKLSTRAFGMAGSARIVLPGRLTHSLHLYGAVCGLASGQEVVLMPRFDPRTVLAELGGAKSEAALYATPTQLHFLAEAARRTGPINAVRQVLASGAKWSDADRRALAAVFPQARLYEFYGASETSFITIAAPDDRVPAGSVGRAAEGVEIAIADPHRPAPPGHSGLIWVRSKLLFSRYICGASPTTRWRDGWLSVGDHGRLDADGFLYLTGRENRMIVTSGLNVYPEEIEAVLADHPAVAVAVAAGLPDPVRGERLEVVVQLTEPWDAAGTELMRYCRDRLAAGKWPRKIHFRDSLPLTAGGKPDIQKILADLPADGEEA
ncbi:class I adenylate-forming enzyme family protein [uncultured Roseibium sp.]|uniref:class I adenylate-forming enzyme family protein n=1 Tax=uncultured Roseibium sp. TaxID=1936171 RepID=UPI0026050E2E|nr:AMP-binding protein [uncultured Roseibium sp.]